MHGPTAPSSPPVSPVLRLVRRESIRIRTGIVFVVSSLPVTFAAA